MRDEIETIGILVDRKAQIKYLAEKKGLTMVTVLEYLLRGRISLEELNKHKQNINN